MFSHLCRKKKKEPLVPLSSLGMDSEVSWGPGRQSTVPAWPGACRGVCWPEGFLLRAVQAARVRASALPSSARFVQGFLFHVSVNTLALA